MRIIVAGMPGVKTQRTLTNVEEAVSKFDDEIEVEWKQYPFKGAVQGGVHTPSVLIDSKIMVSGRIPSLHELSIWITDGLEN
jgi:hypothetical protein